MLFFNCYYISFQAMISNASITEQERWLTENCAIEQSVNKGRQKLELATELKKQWKIKLMVVSIQIEHLERFPKAYKKLRKLETKGSAENIQTTTLLKLFIIQVVSKLLQPIRLIMIYYWDKRTTSNKKKAFFEPETSNKCFFNCYYISFQHMQSFFEFRVSVINHYHIKWLHLFWESFEWFCRQISKVSKVGDHSRGQPEGSLFNSCYTEV